MRNLTSFYISVFLFACSTFTAAASPAKDVNVVNTPNVNVVSMPPIETTFTKPVEVLVNEMPSVTIDNGPNNPVSVKVDAYNRTPYIGLVNLIIEPGQQTALSSGIIGTLPSSGILVIEQIGIYTTQYTDTHLIRFEVRTQTGENQLLTFLNIPQVIDSPPTSLRTQTGSQQVRIYNDLSLSPFPVFYVARFPIPAQRIQIQISVNGYVVPEGSPSLAP